MPQMVAPASAGVSQLEVLHEKVERAVELLAEARKAREEAEGEAARLRAELAEKSRHFAEAARLRSELAEKGRRLAEAERERQDVRRRLERLLKQIDGLTNGAGT